MTRQNEPPNPSGSANEKVEIPLKTWPDIPAYGWEQYLRAEGIEEDMAQRLSRAFANAAGMQALAEHENYRTFEHWANTHTHSSTTSGPGEGVPEDDTGAYVLFGSGLGSGGGQVTSVDVGDGSNLWISNDPSASPTFVAFDDQYYYAVTGGIDTDIFRADRGGGGSFTLQAQFVAADGFTEVRGVVAYGGSLYLWGDVCAKIDTTTFSLEGTSASLNTEHGNVDIRAGAPALNTTWNAVVGPSTPSGGDQLAAVDLDTLAIETVFSDGERIISPTVDNDGRVVCANAALFTRRFTKNGSEDYSSEILFDNPFADGAWYVSGVNPQGTHVALGSWESQIGVWDIDAGGFSWQRDMDTEESIVARWRSRAKFSPSGDNIAFGHQSGLLVRSSDGALVEYRDDFDWLDFVFVHPDL